MTWAPGTPPPPSPLERFTWTMSKPPEPSPRSAAATLTTTSSPASAGPTRPTSACAGRVAPATSTSRRCQPPSGGSAARTRPRRSESISSADRGALVERREGHVEHALELGDGHALVGLVVALGAVGEVDHLWPAVGD